MWLSRTMQMCAHPSALSQDPGSCFTAAPAMFAQHASDAHAHRVGVRQPLKMAGTVSVKRDDADNNKRRCFKP